MQQEEIKQLLESIKDIDLTEEDLDGLYMFLAMNYDTFTNEEKQYWNIIMEKLDPDFKNE